MNCLRLAIRRLVTAATVIPVALFSFSGVNTANAQIVNLGFEINGVECGSTVELLAGRTQEIRGYTTIEAFETDVGGWTQVVEIFSENVGSSVCFEVESTETCGNSCKENLIDHDLLNLIGDLTFVSQMPSVICQEGSALEPEPGRVGFSDATFITWGERLRVGFYRTLPFTVLVDIPHGASEDIVVRLEYTGNLRGLGHPLNTTVTVGSDTLRRPHEDMLLEACEFTIRPVPAGARSADANSSGNVGIVDAIALLRMLFLGDPLPCEGRANDPSNIFVLDSNGDGFANISDAIYLLIYLVLGGDAPTQGLDCRDDFPECKGACRL